MNNIDLCQKALDFKAISDLSDLPKVENVCVSVKADKLEMLLFMLARLHIEAINSDTKFSTGLTLMSK